MHEALPGTLSEHREPTIRLHFINGLQPEIKQQILMTLPATSYQDAFGVAKNIEAGLALTRGVNLSNLQSSGMSNSYPVYTGFVVRREQNGSENQ